MFRMTDGFKLEEFETKSEKMKRRQNNTALVHSTVCSACVSIYIYPYIHTPLSIYLYPPLPLVNNNTNTQEGIPRRIQHHPSVLEPKHTVWRMGSGRDSVWAREGGGCGHLIVLLLLLLLSLLLLLLLLWGNTEYCPRSSNPVGRLLIPPDTVNRLDILLIYHVSRCSCYIKTLDVSPPLPPPLSSPTPTTTTTSASQTADTIYRRLTRILQTINKR